MIIDDLHVEGAAVSPDEADAPLVVDADRVLPCAVASRSIRFLSFLAGRHGAVNLVSDDYATAGGNPWTGSTKMPPRFSSRPMTRSTMSKRRKLPVMSLSMTTFRASPAGPSPT